MEFKGDQWKFYSYDFDEINNIWGEDLSNSLSWLNIKSDKLVTIDKEKWDLIITYLSS